MTRKSSVGVAANSARDFQNPDGELRMRFIEYYEYLRHVRERIGGVTLKRPYTSERDDWIQCMVLAGLGFTYIPEYAVTVPGLVIRPLIDPEVCRTVSLVTVRGRPHSPAVGAFVREAKRHDWAGRSALSCETSADETRSLPTHRPRVEA